MWDRRTAERARGYRRTYMMERAVECASHNLGRIRLVWGRLWGVLSAHLVSAACHPDARVARAAVDHMHLLATTLLARAQLSGFSYQVWPPLGGLLGFRIRVSCLISCAGLILPGPAPFARS